jgi:aminobenzoyl-glutamate utilization protein B
MHRTRWMTAALAAAVIVTLTAHPLTRAGQGQPAPQAAASAPSNPRLDQLKRDVTLEVDGQKEDLQRMNDTVFSFAEPGFQEFETSKYLTAILERNGFKIERNLAGIPTAWMATWGTGKPVIALGSDIDDIPQASQKPGVAWHEPIIEGAPGHGEGHNSGMPMQLAAALAVKKIMEQQHLQGTLKLWPGVAEELLGTKAYYIRAGAFKDVDVCIFAHVGAGMGVSWGDGSSNGLVSVEYSFKGESAHAAGAPWRGRSALDAVELMDIGWNFRREHLRLQQRSHYVIPNGGDQPNVVPPNASVWYYFRETDYDQIKKLWDIGNNMAKAATLMTDTEFSMRVLGSAWPGHFNKTVAETMQANIEKVGMERGRPDPREGATARDEGAGDRAGDQDRAAARTRVDSRRREAGRRVRRHRRHLLERADGDAALPLEHPGRPWPQLGQCHLDGDADCTQRHPVRRPGGRDDGAGSVDAAGVSGTGLGLFP